MTKKGEFETGRIQGKNGWVGNTYDTDAFRQGLLVGETQRQNDILLDQARKAERQAQADEEREHQEALEYQWSLEREEEEAEEYEDEKRRSLSLVYDLREMLRKHGQLTAIERDAFYFATQSALHFESENLDFQYEVRKAGAIAAELFSGEPALNDSLLSLGKALQTFRRKVASHGIVLPFRARYLRNISPRETLKDPCFGDTGERPAWQSTEDSWLSGDAAKALETIEATLRNPGFVVESLAGELSELRRHAVAAKAGGLWRVAPDFLAYVSFKDPETQGVFASPAEVVDLIFSHSDFLAHIESSNDEAETIRQWVLVPNQQVAVFLTNVREGREVITAWLYGNDPTWPKFRETAGLRQGNAVERVPLVAEFQSAVALLGNRISAVHRASSEALEHPDKVDDKVREEELKEISSWAARRRPSRKILEACLIEVRRDAGEWSLAEVDRKTAQCVCSLIGPFYFISQREALLGSVAGVILGAMLFGWGAELTGFLMALASLALGAYGLSLGSHYMPDDISQRFTSLARNAYRACPELSADAKYRVLYGMLAVHLPEEKVAKAARMR